MNEIEQHQTILNKPMSNWNKGIILSFITILIAYPIIQYELDKLNPNFDSEYTFVLYVLFYLPLEIILFITGVYSTVGLIKEKKLFYLFPVLIFLGTATLWVIVLCNG